MKASIDRPNGTKIIIDGTPEEVRSILEMFREPSVDQESESTQLEEKKKSKVTIKRLILELKEDDFFRKKRTQREVRDALETTGHIYSDATIGARLLELVRDDRELGRIKEDGKWVYVHRD